MNYYFRILVTGLTSFVVTAGTAIMASGNQQPTTWGLIVICVGGAVAAAQTIQKSLETPPAV
jgi:hypothetical protein